VKLRYTLRAAEELDQVLSYIDERSPRGAQQVRARIKTIVDLIALHPHAGQRTNTRGLRRVVVYPYPYLIFYAATNDEVVIHGVRHAARQPSSMPE
jgi:toxin ParE1/3/4